MNSNLELQRVGDELQAERARVAKMVAGLEAERELRASLVNALEQILDALRRLNSPVAAIQVAENALKEASPCDF